MNAAHAALRTAMARLEKARGPSKHARLVSALQGLHDTHEHLREHLGTLLAEHAPKPKRAPKPKATVRQDVVDHHVNALHGAGHDPAGFDAAHASLRGDKRVRRTELHAITHAYLGANVRISNADHAHGLIQQEATKKRSLRAYGDAAAKTRPF